MPYDWQHMGLESPFSRHMRGGGWLGENIGHQQRVWSLNPVREGAVGCFWLDPKRCTEEGHTFCEPFLINSELRGPHSFLGLMICHCCRSLQGLLAESSPRHHSAGDVCGGQSA